MSHKNKKTYKLPICDSYDRRKVSRWTHTRWKKVLLAQADAMKIAEFVKNSNRYNSDHNVIESNEALHFKNDSEIGEEMIDKDSVSTLSSTYANEIIIEDCVYETESDADDEDYWILNDTTLVNNTNTSTEDHRLMFPKSNLKVFDVLLMFKALLIKFNITRELQIALLNLIKLLAGPEFATWNYSPYLVSKSISVPPDKTLKHYYCEACNVLLLTIPSSTRRSTTIQCDECMDIVTICNESKNYFITLDLKYQLQNLLNRRDIQESMKDFQESRIRTNENDIVLTDIQDCEAYKKIHNMIPGALTCNASGDGALLFESAKKGFWPLQLHLNELPANLRFKYIILVALWQTEKEPTADFMNLFMSVLINEFKDLRTNGIELIDYTTGVRYVRKIVLLFICVDTVARPLFQNLIKFNGKCGCSWCYHMGKYDSGSMRYPLVKVDPVLRTHQKHLKDVKKAIEYGRIWNGVKGWSVLLELDYFDIIWNLPPEYMHGGLLGSAKQLWKKWSIFHLNKTDIKIIKERMQYIKLPRDIRRYLRSIDYSGKYKAMEWKNWLIFVSLPCLHGILPDDLFCSYALFVESVYVLLKDCIRESELRRCEYYLLKFVGECQIFYDLSFMTFNIHSLLHYCHAVRLAGPLWSNSAFPFENGIYKFLREVNAPNGCIQQIAEKWARSSMFQKYIINEKESTPAIKYCKSIFSGKPPLLNCTVVGNITFLGRPTSNDVAKRLVCDLRREKTAIVEVYDRCIYKSMFFHSINYNGTIRTNDSVIETTNGELIEICHFIVSDNRCYISGYKWVVGYNGFGRFGEAPLMRYMLKRENVIPSLIIIDMNMIRRKAVIIDIKEDVYISFLPNNYEIQ